MTITIDGSGRLVVPTEIRRQAGIRPNGRLEVRFRDGSASRPRAATPELRPGHRPDAPVLRVHEDAREGAVVRDPDLVPSLAALPDVGDRRARVRADGVAVEALVDVPGDVLRLGGERARLLVLEPEEGPHEEDDRGHGR